jgi:hypothetical protein
MSEDFGFAAPPFKADEGLQRLQRALREAGLTARGAGFERRGLSLVQAELVDGQLQAAIVKRPARSPEWQRRTLANAAELRDFIALVQRQLRTWGDRDE